MLTCDVLIVGGGPAGSTCAWRLRQHGADVLVLDRQNFPRDKTCAGWITPPVVESLALNVDEYAATRTWQPITQFRVGVIGRQPVDIAYAAPVSYGIRRCEFDHYLLQRSGARLHLGVSPLRFERISGGWRVNGEIETLLLVGAGGHFCPVARQLGARAIPGATVVTAQEIEFPLPDSLQDSRAAQPERPELYFCQDLAGYGWCFRKQNYLNVGLGRTDAAGLSDHVASLCRYLREMGTLTSDPPARFHGHAYQLYEYVTPRLYDDGVLLIGDAAGLAYPQSGEGIRPAVESGLLAAEVIAAAGGDYSPGSLARYGARIVERFGRPRSRGVAGWIPAAWLRGLGARLLSSRGFVRRCVLEDWFLHSRQPALRLE